MVRAELACRSIGRLAVGLAFASVLLTVLARAIHLDQAWEIHVDEITYLRLSQSVADHLSVRLYGQPFYLHPPAYFFVEGAFLKLWHPVGDVIQMIYAARGINVAFAGLTAGLLSLLGWRTGGWMAAVTVAGIFALDPFAVRVNSRTLLETSAMFWVVAGFAVLLVPSGDGARSRVACIASGVLFGLGLLTKDLIVFVTLLPLGACWLLNWCVPRRRILFIAGAAILTYVPYPLVVVLTGDGQALLVGKLGGLARLVGLVKITGFRPAGPSFIQAVIANLDQFGSTYALLALGGLAVLVLLRSQLAHHRLVALWTVSAYVLVAYCTLFGTLEEQFFYYLVVPVALAIASAAASVWDAVRLRRVIRFLEVILAVVFVAWTSLMWVRVHFTPDNGYERTLAYLLANVDPGVPIGATTEPAEFLLDEYTTGLWSSLDDLRAHRAQYVLLSSRQIATGYAIGAPEMLAWVQAHGRLVFSFDGPTNGTLELVKLPDSWWLLD